MYINIKSKGNVAANVGERGTVAIAEPLSWGPTGVVQTIIPGEDLRPYIGYDVTSDKALFLREMMKGSDGTAGPNKILLYRPAGSGGVQAKATIGELTVTALYPGVRGNDISIIVAEQVDNEGTYDVSTVIDGTVADEQSITDLSQLTANAWVKFTGTGTEIAESAGQTLTAGEDPTVSTTDYANFLTVIEPYQFDIMVYDGAESTVIQAIAQFVERVSNNLGQKCQAVMAGETAANCNSEFVIAVNNGVKLDDGTELTAQQATWWVGGAESGAQYNQTLTYKQYPNAAESNPRLTEDQAKEAIANGYLFFIDNFGSVKVCSDINSLTSFSEEGDESYSKNRVIRTLMQICNDVYEHFSNYFIGKVDNIQSGRNLIKGWMVEYLNDMQAHKGIQDFTAEDVTVSPGDKVDTVVVEADVYPVDAVEKIYMNITTSLATQTE